MRSIPPNPRTSYYSAACDRGISVMAPRPFPVILPHLLITYQVEGREREKKIYPGLIQRASPRLCVRLYAPHSLASRHDRCHGLLVGRRVPDRAESMLTRTHARTRGQSTLKPPRLSANSLITGSTYWLNLTHAPSSSSYTPIPYAAHAFRAVSQRHPCHRL